MIVKKISSVILGLSALLMLSACGSDEVSQKELEKHSWTAVVDGQEIDDIALIFSFKDDTVSIKPDESVIDFDMMENNNMSDAEKEEAKEIAKSLIDEMSYNSHYTLEKNNLHLEDSALNLNANFTVKKENGIIKLIPKDDNGELNTIILNPVND